MVITTTPQPVPASALVDYLRRDIGLSEDALPWVYAKRSKSRLRCR